MKLRTRFAPSPTGYLHLGSARTALFTSLLGKSSNGSWFLRVEDTDRNRLEPQALLQLLTALDTVGIKFDEGVTLEPLGNPDDFYGVYQNGDFGPYIQSERLSLYHEHAQILIDKGLAYWDYLTSEQKNELQDLKKAAKTPINYFQANAHIVSEAELYQTVTEALEDPRKPALRYKLQRDAKIIVQDQLMGKTEFNLALEEDFVFLKSDGYPTYHLAHLVDDHLMQTTHVIRGQEWYASLPLHVQMFIDYWGEPLTYIHIPFILGETGTKKMSKRDGNVNMKVDYLDKGYLPEAIINYIAFLGWNPGTDKELYLEPLDFTE